LLVFQGLLALFNLSAARLGTTGGEGDGEERKEEEKRKPTKARKKPTQSLPKGGMFG
jgi:hypothetical protein